MTEIKPGMIVYMKTTEDPMFVLAVAPIPSTQFNILAGALSGVEATVRRPSVTDKGGVSYAIEKFLVDELETKEDASVRKVAELEELKARLQSTKPSPSPGGILPLSN